MYIDRAQQLVAIQRHKATGLCVFIYLVPDELPHTLVVTVRADFLLQ